MAARTSNFDLLEKHDPQLHRLGLLAERYFADDPNTCLLKLRQLAELLAQLLAARTGRFVSPEETQYDLLHRLQESGVLPREVALLFGEVRRTGNAANHALAGDHRTALATLKIVWQLGVWFHRTFSDPAYKSGPFLPPAPPGDESAELKAELTRLRQAFSEYQASHQQAVQQLQTAQEEAGFWERMAAEAEQQKHALAQRLSEQQAQAAALPVEALDQVTTQANQAASAVLLDEDATRALLDEQLRLAGWEADSLHLRYKDGARPEAGRHLAIAEWPTESGPADYALFIGTACVGVIEAKRRNKDVAAAIDQAKRYARGMLDADKQPLPLMNGDYRVPVVFSTNGRPFQRQFKEVSGTWFCDLRRPQNLRKALEGWYTPQGLKDLLKQDIAAAEQALDNLGFNFSFPLRRYQRAAILAAEQAIRDGKAQCLLAMATGTGKTKTCIALVYRLLKAQRFRRILFLVDRSALGEQAANAFKETQMESLQRFSDIFGLKELDDAIPDADTQVHIATVQGLVKRILYSDEPLPVDTYDCIVVDECHRGYLLDREMSDTEATFRDQKDYVSKYRRVLDHFDAVKIGLTATPALHTSDIFGPPVFVYSYREAVLDGHLVDHDPALHIRTDLNQGGIHYHAGEQVAVYNVEKESVDLYNTPDELDFEVAEFNKKVITENFNRVVCTALTDYLTPFGPEKTLVFCATDRHADMVVRLLKEAFQAKQIEVEDDAILKITGSADKPLALIRKYRNETQPVIAVTVDLLTTGIDVPPISNLVFLRRVNSRILYEQMLGRATRKCDDIGKDSFRIFDAVGIYDSLEAFNTMKPVAQNPNIGFAQLVAEIREHAGSEMGDQAKVQLLAKWQRKKRHLTDSQRQAMEQAGVSPEDFGPWLKQQSVQTLAAWFTNNPDLGECLDRKREFPADPVVISTHDDTLQGIDPHYGKPEDYLEKFALFIKEHGNTLPALTAVVQRPRELTRKDLVQLITVLDGQGFDERSLTAAWAQRTNHDIAARLLGFVRQAALGDPLVPFDQRVDAGVQRLMQQHAFTAVQKDWLKRLASQIKANVVLDEALINEGPFRQQGGFRKLNQVFDGRLGELLAELNEAIWPALSA